MRLGFFGCRLSMTTVPWLSSVVNAHLILILAVAVVLGLVLPSTAAADPVGVISGQVVNRTASGGSVGGLELRLFVFRNEQQQAERVATTGPDGSFRFEGLETSQEYAYQVLLRDALHSAPEGVAIGAAMAINTAFGAFTALAIAVHNVPEATVLSAIVTGRGARLGDAMGLALAVNVPQVLFAVVAMAPIKELGIPHAKVNVNGGACALGHPIGASGARLVVTLVNALRVRGLKRGIATLCIGGGEATAVAVEIV